MHSVRYVIDSQSCLTFFANHQSHLLHLRMRQPAWIPIHFKTNLFHFIYFSLFYYLAFCTWTHYLGSNAPHDFIQCKECTIVCTLPNLLHMFFVNYHWSHISFSVVYGGVGMVFGLVVSKWFMHINLRPGVNTPLILFMFRPSFIILSCFFS